jgi:hypothetical protein
MKFNSYSFGEFFRPASKFLVFIFLAASVAGCQWGDEVKTLVQPNPDNFMVLFSDTSTVTTSTVRYDSVMTGGPGRMLIGRYSDPYFGIMHATTFIQPTLQSSLTIPDGAIYDSLVLSMRYEKTSAIYKGSPYSYGDTTKLMTYSAHALLEDILVKSSYYNQNTTAFDPIPLGTKTFYPRPYTDRAVVIKLSDVLGNKIFEQAKANLLTSNDQWIQILKGLMVTAKSTDNGSVVGFLTSSDSTAIQLHYHTSGVDAVTESVFPFNVTAVYNQILGDRSKTALAELPANRRLSLPASKSGEKTFIQEGTGIMTRIDLPNIRTLKDTKYSVANRAFLRVSALKQSVTRNFTAPPAISLYLCDKNNQLLSPLTDLQGTAVRGTYITDLVNNTEYYSFDVSAYVTSLLNSDTDQNEGLLMITSALASGAYPEADLEWSKGVRRLVIGSQKSTTDPGIKLELYYTTVKAQ